MPIYDPLEFVPGSPPPEPKPRSVSESASESVFNVQEISKEMNIFARDERSFLPPGKDFKDLTPAEEERLRCQYRFAYYRPGYYQTLTKIGAML